MHDKTAAARTFFFLTATLALYFLLWQFLAVRVQLPTCFYGRLIEVLATGLFILLALTTPMKFEEMGIIVPRPLLFRSLLLGGGVGVGVLFILAAMALAKGQIPPFSLSVDGDISRATYFLVAPLQEVLAKSVMYYSLELCFDRRHPHLVNLMSAMLFCLFHVVYGPFMMLLAAALCLLTGWVFAKYRCVWGCALLHFLCGYFPALLGY